MSPDGLWVLSTFYIILIIIINISMSVAVFIMVPILIIGTRILGNKNMNPHSYSI